MTSGERNQAQRYIRSIQRSLAQLEGLVKEIQGRIRGYQFPEGM